MPSGILQTKWVLGGTCCWLFGQLGPRFALPAAGAVKTPFPVWSLLFTLSHCLSPSLGSFRFLWLRASADWLWNVPCCQRPPHPRKGEVCYRVPSSRETGLWSGSRSVGQMLLAKKPQTTSRKWGKCCALKCTCAQTVYVSASGEASLH